MKKKVSLFLALALVLSFVVTSVFAADSVDFDAQTAPYSFTDSGSGTLTQNYEIIDGGLTFTDVTQVSVEWEIQNISVTMAAQEKIWDPESLTWVDHTAQGQAGGITVTPGSATFQITNLSSVSVDANIQFAPESRFAENATWSFNQGAAKEAYSTTLKTIVNSDKTVQTGEAPSCTVTAAVTTDADDFKELPITAKEKFGTYTVTIKSSAKPAPEQGDIDGGEDEDDNTDQPYLTFTGNNAFTLKASNETKTWDGNLEYAVSEPEKNENWKTWDGTGISAAADTYKLYLRGKNTTLNNESATKFVFEGDAATIRCSGNIMTLLNYEQPDNASLMANCFQKLFMGCDKLISAPSLPATTLADYCYKSMFKNCTSLKKAPVLPATALVESCYSEMFMGCSALKVSDTAGTLIFTVPASVPETATTDMFDGCILSDSAKASPAAGESYYYLP